jgi:hypothetical protein
VAIREERIRDGERMTTIVEFLEARLSEDEFSATHSGKLPVPVVNYHQRTLREVASKRRILRRYRDAPASDAALLLDNLRDLASVYADHPDYDQACRALMDRPRSISATRLLRARQQGLPFRPVARRRDSGEFGRRRSPCPPTCFQRRSPT